MDHSLTIANRTERIILNFAHRCALSCEWCYVPFGGAPAQVNMISAIVDRIAELGFRFLTIGGGDPFQYSFLPKILYQAKAASLFVHVDTHAKSMRQLPIIRKVLNEAVDLLGLPLDGSVAALHDEMRSAPGHFDIVIRQLEWLATFRERIKINTMVSAKNLADLSSLAELVQSIKPARWSLYQYWPLGPGAQAAEKHEIRLGTFQQHARVAVEMLANSDTTVEPNELESRRSSYPIVHHDGNVLIHNPTPHNSFRNVGSIFDDEILQLIADYCSGDRPAAATRYVKFSSGRK